MGDKKQIALTDLKIGIEYWVVNGNWSFIVIEKRLGSLFVKCLNGTRSINFEEELVIEEYN